jgi:uncharacterized repeat protein (TIGR02543 family)
MRNSRLIVPPPPIPIIGTDSRKEVYMKKVTAAIVSALTFLCFFGLTGCLPLIATADSKNSPDSPASPPVVVQVPDGMYTVAFSLANGTLNGSKDNPPDQRVHHGDRAVDPTGGIAPSGPNSETFAGWFNVASGILWEFATEPVTRDTFLQAVYNDGSGLYSTLTLTFHLNGGTLNGVSGDWAWAVAPGGVPYEPIDPRRDGYNFDGWYEDDGTFLNEWDFTQPLTTDNDLYAKWNLRNYIVSFVLAGGTLNGQSAVTNQTIPSNGTLRVTNPGDPEKYPLVFSGWFNNDVLWDFSAGTVTGDMTLTAGWNLTTHTVTFNSQGGSTVETQEVKDGGKAIRPADPDRANFAFDGWFTNAACTAPWSFTTDAVTSSAVLYAKWTPVYTITFNSNDNDTADNDSPPPVPARTNVRQGQTLGTAPAPAPAWNGREFGGWYASPDCLGSPYNFAATPVNSNFTLYAKWTKIQCAVTFDLDGGTIGGSSANITLTVEWGEKVSQSQIPSNPARGTEAFGGWFYGSSLFSFENTVIKQNYTLTAKFDVVTRTLYFDLNAANAPALGSPSTPSGTVGIQVVIDGEKAVPPEIPNFPGYTFLAWRTKNGAGGDWGDTWNFTAMSVTASAPAPSGALSRQTLYAQWLAINYTITFDLNGGTVNSDGSSRTQTILWGGTAASPGTPVKGTQQFSGWFLGSQTWNFNTPITANYTLTAKWNVVMRRVDFNMNERNAPALAGGRLPAPSDTVPSQSVIDGETAVSPTIPTCAGYTFEGWYTDEACTGSPRGFGTPVTSDMTLYAKWLPIQCVVTFDLNGGTIGGSSAPRTQTVQWGSMASPPSPNPVNGTKIFSGWFMASQMWNFAANEIRQNCTLTAGWDVVTHSVHFDNNEAHVTPLASGVSTAPSGTVNSQDIIHGEKAAEPQAPNFPGYTFEGWFTGDGTGGVWGNEWNFLTNTVSAETTLYAKWKGINYTVTFDLDGGTIGGSPTTPQQTITWGGHVPYFAQEPVKAHYTFIGWYENNTAWNFAIDAVQRNITLVAKYAPIVWTVAFDLNTSNAPPLPPGFNQMPSSSVPAQTVNDGAKAVAPTVPSWTGYTFAGWYENSALTGAQWNFNTNVTGNKTLYAKWSRNTYTVTYAPNGGTINGSGATVIQTFSWGDLITFPDAPEKTSSTFSGWFYGSTHIDPYTNITQNFDLVARWDIITRTVYFNLNTANAPALPGGVTSAPAGTVPNQTIADGEKAVAPSVPNFPGYTFAGWYSNAGCTGSAYNFAATNITADKTLYAKWTLNPLVRVTFQKNCSDSDNLLPPYIEAPRGIEFHPGAYMESRAGYSFEGWYTSAALTQQAASTITLEYAISLYAKWTELPPARMVTLIYRNEAQIDAQATLRQDGTITPSIPQNGLILRAMKINSTQVTVPIGRKVGPSEPPIKIIVTDAGVVSFRPPSGSYTPIGTVAELKLMKTGSGLHGRYLQEADIDLLGENVTIAYANYNWWTTSVSGGPIGTNAAPFTGEYDGGGHTLDHLLISGGGSYSGLFGRVGPTGKVTNLTVKGTVSANGTYVGGVAGLVQGIMQNCNSQATVTAQGSYVGGVAGYVENGTLTNCDNTGAVTQNATAAKSGVGGVAGSVNNGTLYGCDNSGAVKQQNNAGHLNTGGITGNLAGNGLVERCMNSGQVNSSGNNTGGIVGALNEVPGALVLDCGNTAPVTGIYYAGGVAGLHTGGTVKASRNKGSVNATKYAGGVTGFSGHPYYAPGASSIRLTACYNEGAVTIPAVPYPAPPLYEGLGAGGVAGAIGPTEESTNNNPNQDTRVTACYNVGTVTGTFNTGSFAGHIVVYNCISASAWKTGTNPAAFASCIGGSGPGNLWEFAGNNFPAAAIADNPAEWQTWSGSGNRPAGGNWKPGTVGGGQLPRLWWE